MSNLFPGLFLARHKARLALAGLLFIAASISFALGYLANRELNHVPIIIEKCSKD